eukprot:TRINITY_DN1460_c0_g5_i1.p1 TRINITY_DN1460_c0_g5~~TRINITY_DN1460_c0_g5_i1.p1  ORF type:complete len:674 (+),score=66.25 TRINITY_DN1460_c0_g5_i1:270-2024(+)
MYDANVYDCVLTNWCWKEEHYEIRRGSWFVERGQDVWVPLSHDLAQQLEWAFNHRFYQQQEGTQTLDKVELRSQLKGGDKYFIHWEKEDNAMYLCQNNTLSTLQRKIGMAKAPGARLRRGYQQPQQGFYECNSKQEQLDHYCNIIPVKQLLFVVHGIGQNMQGADIIKDAQNVKNTIDQQLQDEVDLDERKFSGRMEVLPVQWRKNLNLQADELCDKLMPVGGRSTRQFLHQTCVEVLLYLTPNSSQQIMDNLTLGLNETYRRFLARNPLFQGTIGIMAHSLGSALTWDLLAHQPPQNHPIPKTTLDRRDKLDVQQLPDDPELLKEIIQQLQTTVDETKVALIEERRMSQPIGNVLASPNQHPSREIIYQKLDFRVDKLFMIGSPTGLFLVLRGVDPSQGKPLGAESLTDLFPGSSKWGLPNVGRVYNIYHPYDPVAYRMEPLAFEGFESRRPVFVPYYKGGKRFHIGMQAMVDKLYSWPSFQKNQDQNGTASANPQNILQIDKIYDILGGRASKDQDDDCPRGRIDFVVQETPMETPLVSVLMSHFGYWQHLDVLMFVLKAMQGKHDFECEQQYSEHDQHMLL